MADTVRVLHVEDDQAFAELTSEMLTRQSDGRFEVTSASDPEDALELLDEGVFDCVVSDYDMPSIDGISLLRAVRDAYSNLPFILFTGKGSEEVASEAIAAGVTDYLQKGGTETYELLANRIDNAVSQSVVRRFRSMMKHDPLVLLERFSDPLFALDTEWRFTYANEAAAEHYETPVEELLGTVIWEQFPEAMETPYYRHYREALEQGEPRTIEEPFEPWGTYYREYLYPAEDGLTIISYDITEERERAVDLDRSRELRRYTERLTSVGGWEVDIVESNVLWTDGTYRVFGLEPGNETDLGIESSLSFFPDEHRQAVWDAFEACFEAEESFELEQEIERADGERRWVRLVGEPMHRDGEIVGVRGAIRDITGTIEREEELHELSEFREAVIDSANVWINVLDGDGRIVLWNTAAEAISGYTEAEVLGRDDVFERLYPETAYREEILAQVESILRGEASVEEYETTIQTKDGDERVIAWHSHAIYRDGGDLTGSVAIGRDITERKEREREISRLQAMLAEAERLGDIGAWEFTDDGDVKWTDGIYRIHGLDADDPPNLEGVIDFVHPNDRDEINTLVDAAVESDESFDTEVRIITAEGDERWVRTHGGPVGDGTYRGYLQDITEQRHQEEVLRLAKTKLEAAIDAGEIVTWDWDVKQNVLVGDPGLATMFGLDPSAATEGVPLDAFLEAIHDDDRERVEAEIGAALDDCGRYTAEYRVYDADGDRRWVVARGVVECDEAGEPVQFPGSLIDITDRKAREQTLDRTRQRYETILQHSSDYVIIVNEHGEIDYASQAIERATGYTPEEVTGDNALEYVHEGDRERATNALAATLEQPDEEVTVEYRTRVADGSFRWIEVRGRNYLDEPLIEGILVNVRDIHRRKADEQELRRQVERLDEFASVVSHDLRSPLMVAEGQLELLAEDLDDDRIEAMDAALGRMETLIGDLLDLAKAGHTIGEIEAVNLETVCSECWMTVSSTAATLAVSGGLTIHADESRLKQLLENLFRNAVEHGGTDVTVRVGAMPGGFYVEDDGVGIDEEVRGEIFNAGYTTDLDGTGFGLSIVHAIAEAHGWAVRVTDAAGGGARFEFAGVAATDGGE